MRLKHGTNWQQSNLHDFNLCRLYTRARERMRLLPSATFIMFWRGENIFFRFRFQARVKNDPIFKVKSRNKSLSHQITFLETDE